MDELELLLHVYRARPTAPALWKLDVLMDLEPLSDPRILPFLLQVLVDHREPAEVRARVLRHLREAPRAAEARFGVAEALTRVIGDRSRPELRLAAVLALTDFTDVAGVASMLGSMAREATESMDVRYCALSALEYAAPTSELTDLMRRVSSDRLLGGAAGALLTKWQCE
jgi:hypothetical protein